MRTHRPSRRLVALALVAAATTTLALLAPPAADADQFGDGTLAVAAGGMVATGGFAAPDGVGYAVTLVIPDGVTSESPHASGVDFAEPWVSINRVTGGPPAPGTTNPCSVVTNPESWSAGYSVESPDVNNTDHEPRSGVYVDAAFSPECEDGGFEFLRVRWDDAINPHTGQPQGVYDTRSRLPLWSWWGSAVQQTSGHRGALVYRSEASERADLSICGYDGRGFQCLRPDGGTGGSIYFSSAISVIAG